MNLEKWFLYPIPDYEPKAAVTKKTDMALIMDVELKIIGIMTESENVIYHCVINDALADILGDYGTKVFKFDSRLFGDILPFGTVLKITIPWKIIEIYRDEHRGSAYVYKIQLLPDGVLSGQFDQTAFEVLAAGTDHWLGLLSLDEALSWFTE